jgi:phospholipid/cholesterol/gamma-HCH transport system permease protein
LTASQSSPEQGEPAVVRRYAVEREDLKDGRARVRLRGELLLAEAAPLLEELRTLLAAPASAIELDLSGVERADLATLALLGHVQGHAAARVELVRAHGRVAELLERGGGPARGSLRPPPPRTSVFEQVGLVAEYLLDELRQAFGFLGEFVLGVAGALRSPATVPWRSVGRLMELAGADGLPILGLIMFLVGLIMAFQSAAQLKQFGADILVADLVGLVIVRELGPLMTAIVVAGRSGAAFAAELGTMKVSEEIDALQSLGLDPYRFLVLPRVVALVLVLPILTALADLIGVAGGLVTSIGMLDLTPRAYLTETRAALDLKDVLSGLFKSVVFGLAVALISCQRGLSTTGGAAGVGRSTTSAVVAILFHLVFLDAMFTVLFHVHGI